MLALAFINWAKINPVGPAPTSKTLAPNFILILSIPWTAHEAGSIKHACSSVRFLILKHLALSLTSQPIDQASETHYLM